MFDAAIAAAAAANPHKIEQVAMVPGLTVHVDGDYLAYYASGNDETTPGQARTNAIDQLEAFRARVGGEHIVVHMTAPGSHKGERFLVSTVKPYQGQRDTGRKPKNHAYLQDWLLEYDGGLFRSKIWTAREADDGIALCAHHGIGNRPGYIAIATADKDMRMLPGLHINWRQPDRVTRVMPGDYDVIGEDGKQYGLKWFWLQMLMGDSADNCPGLESHPSGRGAAGLIGEKTAEAMLAGCATSDEAAATVIRLYAEGYGEQKLAMDRFVEQAALLWMRCGQDGEVDDFATHAGHSRINQAFDDAVFQAVERLTTRVKIARETINSFGCQDDPLAAACITGE